MSVAELAALQRRVHDAEARFESLINAAADAIIVIDGYGLIESFNAAAERIFACDAVEVIGKSISLLMPEPDAGHHDSYIDNYLKTHHAKIIGIGREVVGRRLNGDLFPMDLSVGEVRGQDSIKFVGIVRDITQRKQLTDALHDREEDLRLVVDNAPGGIFVANADGNILRANRAMCELLMLPEASLIGTSLDALITEDDKPLLASTIATAFHSNALPTPINLTGFRSDLSRIYVTLHLNVVSHRADAPLIIGQVVDRTSEVASETRDREIRAQLEHASRLTTLGEMASAIAHEINQPLTAIATQAQIYRRLVGVNQVEPNDVVAAFNEIAEYSLRIGEIIKRIRGLVTKHEDRAEHVDLNAIIVEVLPLCLADAHDKDVRIETDFTDKVPLVLVDPVQIQRVVLNLMRNGIDAVANLDGERRVVILRTAVRKNEVDVSIEDYGPGVSPAVQSQLFVPFFTTKAEGMGIGLSISHSIAGAHGGTLRYVDRAGGGACFVLSLPVAR